SIYIASVSNTETDLKDFFGYMAKDNLYEGLKHIKNHIKNVDCLQSLIISRAYKIVPSFSQYINDIICIFSANEGEENRLNSIISKLVKKNAKYVSSYVLNRIKIVTSNILIFNLYLKNPIDRIFYDDFEGKGKIQFMG